MEVKKTKAIEVFAYETKTTLKEMMSEVAHIPEELMKGLANQGLNPTGAQIWTYNRIDDECIGDPDKKFMLGVTVPVNKKGADTENYKFKNLQPYKYAQKTHKGAYSEFPEVYGKFIEEIQKAGLEIDGTSREHYINCDFENQENCVTDIQIGIK